MKNGYLQADVFTLEHSAATEVGRFLRREMGLQSAAAHASWTGDRLTVNLTEALTPIGQAAVLAEGGDDLLETAYETLYALHRSHLQSLISRVMGQPVRESALRMDASSGSFILTFAF